MLHHVTLRALAAHLVLFSTNFAQAQDDSTATLTTTLTSTTTVLTITTTVSAAQSTFETFTTETAEVVTSTLTSSQTLLASSSATATATLAIATGAMAYTGEAFQSAVINSTNYFRAQHQASSLVWNDTLASYAQDYAQKCIWEHSGGPYGENLAEGYNSAALSIDAWAAEEKHYNYAKAHFSEKTGHYTQLVWKNTTSVGCGAVECNNDADDGANGWYMVCEYSPAGNVIGEFREMVTKPGESKNDELGFGAAAVTSSKGYGRLVGALVAAYVILAMCA